MNRHMIQRINIMMKNKIFKFNLILLLVSVGGFISCKKDSVSSDTDILHSFSVKGKNDAFFKATINEDNTITIKVSPYVNAEELLKDAQATFYLGKGATVSPDPSIRQDFGNPNGVTYTVTAQDGVTKKSYLVKWGVSDLLADGMGFSYAEIGVSKNFTELGYPGEVNNFGFSDSKLYGDLIMIPAYCGDHIVLFSKAYADVNTSSPHAIKTVDKNTLQPSGSLNLGTINVANLKLLTSDYKGNCVGMVVVNNETEFFVWSKISDTPKSIGKINVNMAPITDGAANFQVAGNILANAWITALAPRIGTGEHYRIKVTNGQLGTSYTKVVTGHSSLDCSGFQMISPLDDSDQPNFVVGDTEGSAGTANSIKVYQKSFAGSTLNIMPGFWQNILQAWWVGTGFSTSRFGGRSPYVSALVINGKSYAAVTSGTAWWHAAAVLNRDLQTLAHQNLNIAESANRAWSYGSALDWYYNEESKEAYLTVWMGRSGLKTYKLTCFE